mgnify:CR=1 FL=1
MAIENTAWTRVRKVKTEADDGTVTLSYELTVEEDILDEASQKRATQTRTVLLDSSDFSAASIAKLDTAASR